VCICVLTDRRRCCDRSRRCFSLQQSSGLAGKSAASQIKSNTKQNQPPAERRGCSTSPSSKSTTETIPFRYSLIYKPRSQPASCLGTPRRSWADPELSGGIIHPIWPGNTSGSPGGAGQGSGMSGFKTSHHVTSVNRNRFYGA